MWTNREATGLKEVPRHLLVLGGGPVGTELAQAIRRMGAAVSVVEEADHVLPREPARLGEALSDALAAEGIELHLGERVSSAHRDDGDFVLDLEGGGELRGDRLLLAAGRKPRVDGIGLETVGVEPGDHGIDVDPSMSAGEGIWAIGDVTGMWPLTHVGKYQGRIVAANLTGESREADYSAVPRVVFTDPQAASVGEPDGKLTATVQLSDVTRTSTYTRAYDTKPGFLDPCLRWPAPDRRIRARSRGRRMAPAGDTRDQSPGAARAPWGCGPTLSVFLGGVPRRAGLLGQPALTTQCRFLVRAPG